MKPFIENEYFSKAEILEVLSEINKDLPKEEQFSYLVYWNSAYRKKVYMIGTKEQYYGLRNLRRDYIDKYERRTRCIVPAKCGGIKKCRENCKNCPYGKTSREGSPYSFDLALEKGYLPNGSGGLSKYYEPTTEEDPSTIYEAKEQKETIYKALETLPEEERKLIILFMKGESDSKIAEVMKSKKSTIQSRRIKIIEKLKKQLEGQI